MPPAFRRTFLSLAAHWRKLASNAVGPQIVGENSFKKQRIVG
jgi:hypothetical protein